MQKKLGLGAQVESWLSIHKPLLGPQNLPHTQNKTKKKRARPLCHHQMTKGHEWPYKTLAREMPCFRKRLDSSAGHISDIQAQQEGTAQSEGATGRWRWRKGGMHTYEQQWCEQLKEGGIACHLVTRAGVWT